VTIRDKDFSGDQSQVAKSFGAEKIQTTNVNSCIASRNYYCKFGYYKPKLQMYFL
jgi:histone acetyltransferase (RNA polymerase elongator complex component)